VKTTFVPLTVVAAELNENLKVLLVAALERRIRLYGLVGQMRRVRMTAIEGELDEWSYMPMAEEQFRFIDYAPLFASNAADLLKDGATRVSSRLSDEDEDGCFLYDQLGPPTEDYAKPIIVTVDQIFLRDSDLEKTKEANPVSGSVTEPREKSLGRLPHRTTLMDAVEAASAKWWTENVRSNDPTTHPTNLQVVDWLTKNHGVKETTAKHIATIVRPDWAHKGAPPRK